MHLRCFASLGRYTATGSPLVQSPSDRARLRIVSGSSSEVLTTTRTAGRQCISVAAGLFSIGLALQLLCDEWMRIFRGRAGASVRSSQYFQQMPVQILEVHTPP